MLNLKLKHRALHKSYSIADFKQHLRALGQRVEFDNATKALIREIEGGLPPDDGGGGALPSPHLGDSGSHGGKPPSDGGNGGKGNGDGELISKTTPTRKATKEDLTEEFLEEVKRRKNDKVWIGDLSNPKIIEHLGFDPNKPIKMLFDGDALIHIEKRHGEGSNLVEISKQPAVKLEDIQNYPDIVNHADLIKITNTPKGKRFLAGKQINGYMVVVENIGTKNNQLTLKTIYKENGKLENSKEFKESISNHNVADSRPLNTGDSLDTAMDESNPTTTPLKSPNIEPNPAFGEHFKEFEGKGAQAVAKLLKEKRGQVAGAFYREDLGYIDLVWGQSGTGKSDGWGLSKIAKYHHEVLDNLEELIQTLPIVKETANCYQLENTNYKASIRKDFEGVAGNWILTAFEKRESIARRSTDSPSTQKGAKKTPLADTSSVAQKSKSLLNIEPNPAFG
ncbi:PBECR3 domain-containing polyvalent protein, partial [Helicobacter felis]